MNADRGVAKADSRSVGDEAGWRLRGGDRDLAVSRECAGWISRGPFPWPGRAGKPGGERIGAQDCLTLPRRARTVLDN